MIGKMKKTLGMQPKQRSRKEVDEEYTREAIWYGHKTRIASNLYKDVEKVEKECEAHLQNLVRLNEEGMRLPPNAETTTIAAIAAEETKEAQK